MRFRSIFVLPVVVAGLCAAPAWAQSNFTGFRAEGVVGWDNFSAGDRASNSKDDVTYGGTIGFDVDLDRFVVGAEAEFSDTGVALTYNRLINNLDELKVEGSRDIYVGGRAGYAVSDQWLVYAKMGYTNFKVKSRYDSGLVGGVLLSDSNTQDGFRAGAGIEYQSPQRFYVKGEYRYSHYGNDLVTRAGTFDVDTDRNQILLGVGYRF